MCKARQTGPVSEFNLDQFLSNALRLACSSGGQRGTDASAGLSRQARTLCPTFPSEGIRSSNILFPPVPPGARHLTALDAVLGAGGDLLIIDGTVEVRLSWRSTTREPW